MRIEIRKLISTSRQSGRECLGGISVHPLVLLGILSAGIVIYGSVLLRYNDVAHLGMSILFLLGIATLCQERCRTLTLVSDRWGVLTGVLLLLGTLWSNGFLLSQSFLYQEALAQGLDLPRDIDLLLRLQIVFLGFGVALLASGWRRLHQFWRELVILLALALPGAVAGFMIDISPITARFATALLWYSGVDVVRDGVRIFMEGGGVRVYSGCSGLESMSYLLGLSILGLVMFPLRGIKPYFVPLIGLFIGFVINGIRVALMAILAANEHKEAFDYWHIGQGSLLFGGAAVLAFGGVYMGLQVLDDYQRGRAKARVAVPEEGDPPLPDSVVAFLEAPEET